MSPEALARRLDEIVDKQEELAINQASMATDLKLLREDVGKQATAHTACMERCSNNRKDLDKRMRPLEEKQAVSTAKVSFIWGILGTVIGSVIVAGVVAWIAH